MNAVQNTEAAQPETTVVNGYIVNAETGEVLGLADRPQFEVTDLDSLNWVLKRMSGHRARLTAMHIQYAQEQRELEDAIEAIPEVKALRSQIAAMDARFATITPDHERAMEWLERRYSDGISAVFDREMEGQKARTLKTLWGNVSKRHMPDRVVVTDDAAAIHSLRSMGETAAIKETVQVSKLGPAVRKLIETDGGVKGFEFAPGENKMTIEVGV